MILRCLLLALPLLGAGCAPDLQALAHDTAAVCVRVTSVWTTVTLDRNWGCEMPAVKAAAP